MDMPSQRYFRRRKLDELLDATGLQLFKMIELRNGAQANKGHPDNAYVSVTRHAQSLQIFDEDRIIRGSNWLKDNAGKILSITNNTEERQSVVLRENFTQLLILEATGDRSLVDLVRHPSGKWNFFHGKGLLTDEEFPCDLDTTTVALTALPCEESFAHAVLDEILDYVTPEGISMVYFDHTRPRLDPAACANTLSLFYSFDRGGDLPKTLAWVQEVLGDQAYVNRGTRYYEPVCFLFLVGRLLKLCDDKELHAALKPLLAERIQERFGLAGDAVALAMRIIVGHYLGMRDELDLQALLGLQRDDGGWEIGWLYRYGKTGILIGNRGLATALAIKAIEITSLKHCQ